MKKHTGTWTCTDPPKYWVQCYCGRRDLMQQTFLFWKAFSDSFYWLNSKLLSRANKVCHSGASLTHHFVISNTLAPQGLHALSAALARLTYSVGSQSTAVLCLLTQLCSSSLLKSKLFYDSLFGYFLGSWVPVSTWNPRMI